LKPNKFDALAMETKRKKEEQKKLLWNTQKHTHPKKKNQKKTNPLGPIGQREMGWRLRQRGPKKVGEGKKKKKGVQ